MSSLKDKLYGTSAEVEVKPQKVKKANKKEKT